MNFQQIILYLTFICFASSEFVATKEWQQVPEGESIPAGLHVRLDLEKGGKWAKLLDQADKNREIVAENVHKAEVIVHEDDAIVLDPELQKKRDRVKYLASIWEDLQGQVITDFKQMEILLTELDLYSYRAQLVNFSGEDEQKYEDVCDDLGILLSQVDNAMDAVKHGILGQILGIYEKYPHRNILRLFTSASQNNPPVAKALKNALMPIITNTILHTSNSSPMLKSALFTLSAITRSIDESAVLEFDWRSMMNAQPHNEQLCTLIIDLGLPYKCGKQEL